MKSILVSIFLLISTLSFGQKFYSYGNLSSRTVGAGLSRNITITLFNGGYKPYPDANYATSDITTGMVVWINCTRYPITAIVTTSPLVLTVADSMGTGGLDGLDLYGYRLAILEESRVGAYNIAAFPDIADGNAGSQAGLSPKDGACIENYYGSQLDLAITNASVSTGDKGDIDVVSSTDWRVDTSAITTIKIASNAIDSTKIAPGGIGNTDLAAGIVSWSKLAQAVKDSIGDGDVKSIAASTDNALARYHGTSGDSIQNSAVIVDDNGNTTINTSGSVNAFTVSRDSGEARLTIMSQNDVFTHNIGNQYPFFQMIRNNYYGGAYRPMVVSDLLGRIGVQAPKNTAGDYNGDGALGIDFFATENWTNTATGSRIAFHVTPTGSTGTYFPLSLGNTVNHQSAVTAVGDGTVKNLFSVRQTFAGTEVFNILKTGKIGIGIPSPTSHFQIDGNMTEPAWTTDGIAFDVNAATYTDTTTAAAGTVAVRTANSFGAPTFASTNAMTVTDAFNLYVPKPIAGTNNTFTRANSAYFEGAVGFGTTSPGSPLEISSSTNNQIRLRYNGTHYTDLWTGSNGAFHIDAGTNIDIALNRGFTVPAGYGFTILGFGSSFVNNTISLYGVGKVTGASSGDWQFNDGTINTVIFKAGGSVGIGTTSPDKQLGFSDGTDEFSLSVASDKFTVWNDAGTPVEIANFDSIGVMQILNNGTGNQDALKINRSTGPAVGGYTALNFTLALDPMTSLRSIHEVNGSAYSASLHTLTSGVLNTTPAWYATHLNKFAVNRDTAVFCLDVKGSGTDALLGRFQANDENSFVYIQNTTTGSATTDGLTLSMTNSDATISNRESGTMTFSTAGTPSFEIDAAQIVTFNKRVKGRTGDGSTITAMGGVLKDFYTDVANSGTSETDLYADTTATNTLSVDGDKLTAQYTVNLLDVTATAQLQVYFAGTLIGNTGALTVSATGAAVINVLVIRTGATTARASVNISTPGASTAAYTAQTDLSGEDWTATNILKITGTSAGAGGGSNDIIAKLGVIEWKPAGVN